MHMIEELEKLCNKAMESITESNKKLEKENERLSPSDVTYLDGLCHMIKSIKAVVAMEEYSDDGYSGSYDGGYSGSRYRRRYMETRDPNMYTYRRY